MEPLREDQRIVKNIYTAEFSSYQANDDPRPGQSVLQLDDSAPLARSFFVFRMEPGAISVAHVHGRGEHFFIIEGDLHDHDGYEYKAGDLVYLRPGTIHNSTTDNGCTLVAYLESAQLIE